MTEAPEFKFSRVWAHAAFFCGLDVHKHQLAVAVFARDDSRAEFLKTNTFATTPAGFLAFWAFARKYRPVAFAIEATGVYHNSLATFLETQRADASWTYHVHVVNPADASGVPGGHKHDRVDTEMLARYLAAGVIWGGRPVVEALNDLRAIFRAAAKLETARTACKNRVKKTLDRAGFRPRRFDLNLQWTRALVVALTDHAGPVGELLDAARDPGHPLQPHWRHVKRPVTLSQTQRALVRQDLMGLEFATARKALLAVEVDRVIAARPGLRQQVHHLATIPGVSPFSAAWFLAEVPPVDRFANARAFLSFVGCCPRTVKSAGRVLSAHLTRRSNRHAHTILYNILGCSIVLTRPNQVAITI